MYLAASDPSAEGSFTNLEKEFPWDLSLISFSSPSGTQEYRKIRYFRSGGPVPAGDDDGQGSRSGKRPVSATVHADRPLQSASSRRRPLTVVQLATLLFTTNWCRSLLAAPAVPPPQLVFFSQGPLRPKWKKLWLANWMAEPLGQPRLTVSPSQTSLTSSRPRLGGRLRWTATSAKAWP